MKKQKGLKSGHVIKIETGNNLPITPAEKLQMIIELMNCPVVDKNGNPVLKKDGTPKTTSLISKKQAKKLLDFK